jgi:Zn ribbon nucleic-acid-binding protein
MDLKDRIIEIIQEEGLQVREHAKTLHTTCPACGKSDKLSILKENGATICYRGSCGFKGWFEDWIAQTAGVSPKEAKARLMGPTRLSSYDLPDAAVQVDDSPKSIRWPIQGLVSIASEYFQEGKRYLESRGIPADVAAEYGILYGPDTSSLQPPHMQRRVFIPVVREKRCYGFQARAIDKVPEKDRMRNNEGFRRDRFLMFEDRLDAVRHAIVAEGPFDAIKFHLAGGNVATMGKVVTEKQLELIRSRRPVAVYLALDDDAGEEIMALSRQFTCPVYHVTVPDSAIARCRAAGKKADFGECTFDEAVQAVRDAVLIDESFLV